MYTHCVCVVFLIDLSFSSSQIDYSSRQIVATRGDCSFRTDFAVNRVGCVDMTMSLREKESNRFWVTEGEIVLRCAMFIFCYDVGKYMCYTYVDTWAKYTSNGLV